jgi:hypothetical protein
MMMEVRDVMLTLLTHWLPVASTGWVVRVAVLVWLEVINVNGVLVFGIPLIEYILLFDEVGFTMLISWDNNERKKLIYLQFISFIV